MNNALPFEDLGEGRSLVAVTFQGQDLRLPEGANLAAALLAAGITTFRHTAESGAPRGPFCMMGACFDCLVEVDGISRQACMMEVSKGLNLNMPAVGER
ncbi:2Fe-2S iron-sulfur cluster-binding protein [Roseovarius sp.]|uniref:2Fe-2S iron-sulfur cluster-binding protein n=1 Tax=Roseovarius sp. TaxID=1486281 RepID=UPI00263062C6|nr:2Fe-2S iron-sulfur cluster-binding protein [Roseovarius sp.]